MAMSGPNELLTLLTLFFSSGFGLSVGVPPESPDPMLARVAPDECIFYAASAGQVAPDPDSQNQTEQLLAEAEVQQLIATITHRAEEAVQEAAANPRAPQTRMLAEAGPLLLKTMLTRPSAVFISKVLGPDGLDVEGGLIVNASDEIQRVAETLQRLQSDWEVVSSDRAEIAGVRFYQLRLPAPLPTVLWGVRGEYLIMGIGEGSVEAMFERAQTDPPQWLVDYHDQLRVDRVSSISYLNVDRLIQIIPRVVPNSRAGKAMEALDALGLTDVDEIVSVAGLDETGFVTRSWIGLDGPPRGLLAPLDAAPLTAECLDPIPHDAMVASAFRLDLGESLETWLDILGRIEPRAAEEIQREIGDVEEELGIRIRDDLLGSLGDVWTVFTAPSDGGLLTGWTATVQIRDREKLAQTHSRLVRRLNAELEGQRRAPQIRQMEFEGHDVFYLVGPDDFPLSPAWCLTEDQFVISLFSQSLKSYLSRGEDYQSIADLAGSDGLLQADPAPLAVTYADSQSVFRTVYPYAQVFAHMGLAQARRRGLGLDPIHLPSGNAIEKHLLPYISAVRRSEAGIELLSHQTLPGGNLGATAPLAVGLLLPAVQSAREAARRAQSANNMKQIGLAMHNFHDAYNYLPAAYNADQDGKPGLSWRVHMLPFLEQSPLYDQFHLDEPWDSEHNKQLIARMPVAYRSPNSKAEPGETVYLGIRGEDKVFGAPKVEPNMPLQRRGTSFRDIRDGLSNTIMVVEANDAEAVIWTKPDDLEPDQQDPLRGLLGLRRGGFQALFGDGSVLFIAESIAPDTLKAMFTTAGGEVVRRP